MLLHATAWRPCRPWLLVRWRAPARGSALRDPRVTSSALERAWRAACRLARRRTRGPPCAGHLRTRSLLLAVSADGRFRRRPGPGPDLPISPASPGGLLGRHLSAGHGPAGLQSLSSAARRVGARAGWCATPPPRSTCAQLVVRPSDGRFALYLINGSVDLLLSYPRSDRGLLEATLCTSSVVSGIETPRSFAAAWARLIRTLSQALNLVIRLAKRIPKH